MKKFLSIFYLLQVFFLCSLSIHAGHEGAREESGMSKPEYQSLKSLTDSTLNPLEHETPSVKSEIVSWRSLVDVGLVTLSIASLSGTVLTDTLTCTLGSNVACLIVADMVSIIGGFGTLGFATLEGMYLSGRVTWFWNKYSRTKNQNGIAILIRESVPQELLDQDCDSYMSETQSSGYTPVSVNDSEFKQLMRWYIENVDNTNPQSIETLQAKLWQYVQAGYFITSDTLGLVLPKGQGKWIGKFIHLSPEELIQTLYSQDDGDELQEQIQKLNTFLAQKEASLQSVGD